MLKLAALLLQTFAILTSFNQLTSELESSSFGGFKSSDKASIPAGLNAIFVYLGNRAPLSPPV